MAAIGTEARDSNSTTSCSESWPTKGNGFLDVNPIEIRPIVPSNRGLIDLNLQAHTSGYLDSD